MRRRADRQPPQPAGATHLVRSARWSGLRAGDPVEVAGMARRATTWSFVAHVRNARTGEEWVEVVGGRSGDRALRSFDPGRIYAPASGAARTRARSSLADAPQLPLG